jgi:hypothetical protein
MTPPSPGTATPLAATDTAASQSKYGHAMPDIAEPAVLASYREHDPARIARGLAALVLKELPRSLAERELDGNTELTCRIRALTLELCAAYGLDSTATVRAIIGHVLDHLAAYLPGLDAPPPHYLLPAQPLCETVQAWVVNRLGDASEQYPEIVIPLLRRAAGDYQLTEEAPSAWADRVRAPQPVAGPSHRTR